MGRPTALPTMEFQQALDDLIEQALGADDGPDVAEVVFCLGQAELGIRMAILQAETDGVEDDAEDSDAE